MSYDWSGVRERVTALVGKPLDRVFGASTHRFELEPPLTPTELAELETQLGVRLPGEYRSFLLAVSRGGAGPYYGLFPLRRVNGRWQWDGAGADLTDLDRLTEPFPHADSFNPVDGLGPPPDDEEFDSTDEFKAAEHRYWKHHEEVTCDPALTVGALYLCHEGCGYQYMLVVSGPQRGKMWTDEAPDDSGFNPVADADGNRMGFARWYLNWLDQATAEARQ